MKRQYQAGRYESSEIMLAKHIISSTIMFCLLISAVYFAEVYAMFIGCEQSILIFKKQIEKYTYFLFLLCNLAHYVLNKFSELMREFRCKLLKEITLTIAAINKITELNSVSQKDKDRRKCERYKSTFPLRYNSFTSPSHSINGILRNYSDSGICLDTPKPHYKGEKLALQGKVLRDLCKTAIVIWTEILPNNVHRIGLMFEI